jgi:hypothetical protein
VYSRGHLCCLFVYLSPGSVYVFAAGLTNQWPAQPRTLEAMAGKFKRNKRDTFEKSLRSSKKLSLHFEE